ncbi:hypothetical protein [Xanthomarina gelatinilytica]|uniref:hypothetical protein n=1 Tax=Xanthomarina gelatinilytica TaxID=1137281 RepID=UPI0005916F0F|nr:hypothetical protein [Xanthomarina gelatinilytica]
METQISTYIKYAGMLLCSALLFFACCKEKEPRNEPDPTEKPEFLLTASAREIDKDDTVTFDVKAEGKVMDADIYIGKTKISGTSHTFEEAGTYKVIAKKEGYSDSEIMKMVKRLLCTGKTA